MDPDTDPGRDRARAAENPAGIWSECYAEEKWESGIYRVGNLTLLEASVNRDVATALRGQARGYAESAYALTRRIPTMAPEGWTPELVDERQRLLAEVAARAWRSDFA